jgi:hypothetical protein
MDLLGEEPLDAEQPAAAAFAGGDGIDPPAADLVPVPDAGVHAEVEAPDAAA